jgi:hypothetical protein
MGGEQLVQSNNNGAAVAKEKVLAKVKAKRNLRKVNRVVRRDVRSSKRIVRKDARSSKKASRKSSIVVRSVRTKKSMKFKGSDEFVSGLAGGIAGGLISNLFPRPFPFFAPPPPPPVVVVQRPAPVVVVERERPVVVVERAPPPRRRRPKLEPWSGEWYKACADTFDSFNARTGYYVTYGGDARFCTVRR